MLYERHIPREGCAQGPVTAADPIARLVMEKKNVSPSTQITIRHTTETIKNTVPWYVKFPIAGLVKKKKGTKASASTQLKSNRRTIKCVKWQPGHHYEASVPSAWRSTCLAPLIV